MAKYYEFHYSTGYYGTDENAIYKFPDCVSEEEVEEAFDDWYENTRTDEGDFKEISEEEAEMKGVDEDLTN